MWTCECEGEDRGWRSDGAGRSKQVRVLAGSESPREGLGIDNQ